MGCWYSIDGKVKVRNEMAVEGIVKRLEDRAGEIEVATDDHGDGTLTVTVSGGIMCSYTTAEEIDGIVKEFGPFAVEPGEFLSKVDDEGVTFWVGDPEQVRQAKRAKRLAKIKNAVGKLDAGDRATLLAELSGTAPAKPLADSLSRVAFILHKIDQGDHKALENAPDAVSEAVAVMEGAGYSEEWFEQTRDE